MGEYHEKPYKDEDGNWVVPINDRDNKFIFGRIDQFMSHARGAQQNQLNTALKARDKNLQRGGNRGTIVSRRKRVAGGRGCSHPG
ncbi:hypothetical protein LCGC14_0790870 [marine sediment metagenome]|uniref:Uncharacterized protein n=1 Tax=marine sediment metagenome TaxID=412755 RepID=A0A0F9PSN0_9ZZZZ